ncbi:MAG: hypothetical protein ABH828_06430 [archaeon]
MMSTIQISKETKEKISSFGLKGETYEEIINRIYDIAVKEHFNWFIENSEKAIPIDEAIDKMKKKWQK